MSLLLVNVQLVEQATADRAQQRFDRFGTKVGQDDRAAGALVVAAGGAKPVDHGVERLARPAAQRAGTRTKASAGLQTLPRPATSRPGRTG